jgi:hypothetical protein
VSGSHLTRRDFAKITVAAAGAPFLVGSSPPVPAATSRCVACVTDPLADALTEYIRARYGSRLSPEELARVRSAIHANLQAAEQLRTVPLPTTVEPMWAPGTGRAGGE